METPFQRRVTIAIWKSLQNRLWRAGLLAGGLLVNPFSVIARAISGVATVKKRGLWQNPLDVSFGGVTGFAGRWVLSALGQNPTRGAAFNFFSST